MGNIPIKTMAYVANSTIPSRQANTVHVLNMSAAFAECGVDLTLIARGEPQAPAELFRDFDLDTSFAMELEPRRRSRALDRLQFVRRIRRAARARPLDFAYGRSGFGLLFGIPDSVPIAYDVHVFPASRPQRWLEGILFRRRNFRFVTAITEALRAKYLEQYPALQGRILVAPCAAKVQPQAASPASREPGPARIYYVGHLYRGRGIDRILTLAEQLPELEFHIVGGEESDIAYWTARAPANVRFHGHLPPVELPAHFRRADICLAPHDSKVEPAGGGSDIAPWMSPMKIFEYMSHGKAILAADLPVIREVIESGREGLLCPVGDLPAWRSAIERLSSDLDLARRLGDNARARFEREFTWKARAERILARASAQSPDPEPAPAAARARGDGA